MFRSEVLNIPAFRRLLMGQAVSQFGDALYFLLFLFVVDRLTGSAAMVGYVGALEAIPFLLFGPYAGVVADRRSRKGILLFCDLTSAALLILLGGAALLTPHVPVPLVLLSAFLLALVNTFFTPAKSAAVPALVPPEHLMEANGLSMAIQNGMPLFGIALSGSGLGLVYRLYPALFLPAAAFLNALTFLVSALSISGLPRLMPLRDANAPPKKPLADALDGFRFLKNNRVLRTATVLNLFLNLFIAPFMVAHVKANRDWFGGQYGTIAAFEAAFIAAMVVTSLFLSQRELTRPGLGFIAGLAPIGFFVALMAYTPNFWGYLGLNLLCGLTIPLALLPMGTYTQLVVPDAFRGRVQSAQAMVSRGVTPLSMGLAGIFLERFGLKALFLIMGIGMGVSALIGLLDRDFREAKMPRTAPSVSASAP